MGGYPRFSVEFACGRRPEVAARDVNNSIGHADGAEHVAFHVEEALVFCLGVFGFAVGEHFDFVELVDT